MAGTSEGGGKEIGEGKEEEKVRWEERKNGKGMEGRKTREGEQGRGKGKGDLTPTVISKSRRR